MGMNVRVVKALQGVAFDVEVDGDIVHAVASAGYLESQHGARDEPTSWLRAYQHREAEIDDEARAVARERGDRMVLLIDEGNRSEDDTMPAALSRH